MLKRYSHFFAYLLLVLMPMQALATANMLVCNSMMQANIVKQSAELTSNVMPCHQDSHSMVSENSEHVNHQQLPHKSSCASVCANICALTAMPAQIQSTFALNFTQAFDFNHQSYASITLPNLQRPPIVFI